MNEELKNILSLVESYSKKYLKNIDIVNIVKSCLEFWLTQGHFYDEFEEKLSKLLNIKYVSFVNIGSSANLLAFMALTSPLLGERSIKEGDEVITIACSFPTMIAPILQSKVVPVFLDVDIPTYNIKVEFLEKALTKKTKAVFLAHTLGNLFDIIYIKNLSR